MPLITAIRAHRPTEYVGARRPHDPQPRAVRGRARQPPRGLAAADARPDRHVDGRAAAAAAHRPAAVRHRRDRPRLDEVAFCHESALRRTRLRELLREVPDLERIVGRVVAGSAQPRELVALRRGLEAVPLLARAASGDGLPRTIASCVALHDRARTSWPPSRRRSRTSPARRSSPATSSGPASRRSWTGCGSITRDVRRFLAELEAGERERTGIRSLKVGYNRVFGYYIEVSKANLALVPEHYERRQTLVNAERYVTPQLREYETQILQREGPRAEIETAIFRQVCGQVGEAAAQILAHGGRGRRARRRLRARRGGGALRLRPPGARRRRRDRDPRRPPPGGRALAGGGRVRAERHDARVVGRADRRAHRAEHGGQVDVPAPGRADRADGADRELRAGVVGARSASSTASSRASARGTTSRPASRRSWSRCSRPARSCTTRRRARSSSSTRSAAARAPTTAWRSRAPSSSTCTTGRSSRRRRCSRRTTTS